MNFFIQSFLLFILFVTSTTNVSHARQRVIFLPFEAPLLTTKQNKYQTRLFEKTLTRYIRKSRIFHLVMSDLVIKEAYQLGIDLQQIKKSQSHNQSLESLCDRLQADMFLWVDMRLGTNRDPAYLIPRTLSCIDYSQHEKKISFSGKLTKRMWKRLNPTVKNLMKRSRRTRQNRSSSSYTTPPSDYNNPPPVYNDPPPVYNDPPPVYNDPPPVYNDPPPVYNDSNSSSMSAPDGFSNRSTKSTLKLGINETLASIKLWGGGRLLSRSFNYQTSADSPSFKGGISYDSQWIPGSGAELEIAPWAHNSKYALSNFSLRGDFTYCKLLSMQTIPNLFDEDEIIALNSVFLNWSAGFAYNYLWELSQQQQRIAFITSFRSTQLNIEDNLEYNGYRLIAIDLELLASLTVIPQNFWFEISGILNPFIHLGDSVQELGESSDAYGVGFSFGLYYRSSSNISLRFKVAGMFSNYQPQGIGRNGRIGSEAGDQTIQILFDLGWVYFP